jgi:hypothetical protein
MNVERRSPALGVNSRRIPLIRWRKEVWYSATVGLAVFAVVFTGFARSFYLGFLFHAPRLDWLVRLHGLLMTAWFLLFFCQVGLIGSRRVALHRRLGWLGLVLIVLIVVVGPIVAIRGVARDLHAPVHAGPPPLLFLGFLLASLLLFASFAGTGIVMRRTRGYHMRFMLLACLSICGPGVGRIPFEAIPALAFLGGGGPFGLFGLDLLFLYAAIAWDSLRNRRLHAAFAVGAVPLMLMDTPLANALFASPAWMSVGHWLVTIKA